MHAADEQCCSTLPHSLTDFSWYGKLGDAPRLLPAQLTKLCLGEWQIAWFHLLPRNITRLLIYSIIPSSNATGTADHFLQLPKSLTTLSLASDTSIELSSTALAHLDNLTDLSTYEIRIPSVAIVYLLER